MDLTKKEASILQEKYIAKFLNGRVQGQSGGSDFGGGDVHINETSIGSFLIEAKTVLEKKKSYSIKESILKKMKEQQYEQGKDYSALAFRLSPNDKDWYVIDENTFKALLYKE